MSTRLDLPPPPVADWHGGDSRWVELTRASDDIDAHLLIGRLTEAGVDVRSEKDRRAPGAWLHGGSDPWAPVVIFVRTFQLADARLVLAEIAFDGPSAEPAVPAPSVRDWRTPVLWWSLALTLGIGLTAVALAQTARSMELCDLPLVCGEKGR